MQGSQVGLDTFRELVLRCGLPLRKRYLSFFLGKSPVGLRAVSEEGLNCELEAGHPNSWETKYLGAEG